MLGKISMSENRLLLVKRIVVVGLIIAMALGLRLYQLGHENFWMDEIYQVKVASQSLRDIVLNYNLQVVPGSGKKDQAPLSFIVTHFFVSSEDTERMARLPSAIFGTLGVLALFVIGCQLFSYRVALLATVFLAISPLHLWYSQEARWYAQWGFITTLSYIALVYSCRTDRTTSWIIYGLTLILNVYTFIYSIVISASQVISLTLIYFLQKDKQPSLLRFLSVHFLVICVSLPVLWVTINRLDNTTGWLRSVGLGELPYTFFAYTAGFSVGPTLHELHALPSITDIVTGYPIILIFAAVFFPVMVLGALKVIKKPIALAFLLPWFLGLPVLSFFIAILSNVAYQVRYTFASLPAFALILAIGIFSVKSRMLRGGCIFAIVFCNIFALSNFYWDGRYNKEDIRAAMVYINKSKTNAASVFSLGPILRSVQYYGKNLNIVRVGINECNEKINWKEPEQSTEVHDINAVWVIASRDWENCSAAYLNSLSKSYVVTDHQRFTGVNLWLLKSSE
jgi:4-amino-4-deoxy-L-arabinose transferase-like glycosyltransferase